MAYGKLALHDFWCQVAITALIQVGADDDWNFAGDTVAKKEVFMLMCRQGR